MTRLRLIVVAAGFAGVALVSAGAANAGPSRADTHDGRQQHAEMARMHELMMADNPGMARMHELMMADNPGMARMHEQMTDGS